MLVLKIKLIALEVIKFDKKRLKYLRKLEIFFMKFMFCSHECVNNERDCAISAEEMILIW